MFDIERLDAAALSVLRDALTGDTRLARRLSLLEPTKKLARMLAGVGASLHETHSFSIGMPNGDLSSHCSREISAAQVIYKGDSRYATSSLPA
jgi:hypothetical protein